MRIDLLISRHIQHQNLDEAMMSEQLMLDLVIEESVTILSGKWWPVMSMDMEHRASAAGASVRCSAYNRGFTDGWRHPYPGRMSAERNAALWGRDMIRARGFSESEERQLLDALNRFFDLPERREG